MADAHVCVTDSHLCIRCCAASTTTPRCHCCCRRCRHHCRCCVACCSNLIAMCLVFCFQKNLSLRTQVVNPLVLVFIVLASTAALVSLVGSTGSRSNSSSNGQSRSSSGSTSSSNGSHQVLPACTRALDPACRTCCSMHAASRYTMPRDAVPSIAVLCCAVCVLLCRAVPCCVMLSRPYNWICLAPVWHTTPYQHWQYW